MKSFQNLSRLFLTAAILLFYNLNLFAQGISSNDIDNLVQKTMQAFNVPGIAVAVVKDDKIVHMKGYGVSSIVTKEKTDENTLFAIASNSKAFTPIVTGKQIGRAPV